MQLIQTHVMEPASKVVKTVMVERKPEHIIDLRMATDECVWIETPAGSLRISTTDFQGRTLIEVTHGDAKVVKFRRW